MDDYLTSLLSPGHSLEHGQTTLLIEKLIHPNAQCKFGLEHGFANIESVADFKSQVPLCTYEEIRAYTEEVAAGDSNILTSARTLAFFQTSGSMSKPKLIPVTTDLMRQKTGIFAAFWEKIYQDYPDIRTGKMVSNFSDASEPQVLDSGLSVFSESSFWGKRGRSLHSLDRWPLPREVRQLSDPKIRTYASARLLLQSELHCIMCLNPSTLLQFCRSIESYIPQLAQGLEEGNWGCESDTFFLPIQHPEHKALQEHLIVNQEAANRLKKIIENGVAPSLKRLWPMLNLAIFWQSKTVQPYIKQLSSYLQDLPTRDYITQSSECMMAVPVEDNKSGGLLAHTAHFFEFIAEKDANQDQPTTYSAWELTEGERYEIVVTTGGGLYRYRMGDCVQVNGFRNSVPEIEFLYRLGRTSSITGEKLTEIQVLTAAEQSNKDNAIAPVEFLLFPCSGNLPHYALVLDFTDQHNKDEGITSWVNDFERNLQSINTEYADKRNSGRLGSLVTYSVRPGGLTALRQNSRGKGVSEEQVKAEVLSSTLDWHLGKTGVERI